jgi:hypothetical protein
VSGQELEPVAAVDDGVAQIAKSETSLDRVARLGMWLAAAESKSTDPKARGMAAALRIAYAESLGLPAHAASEIHIINGSLATSAQLKRAQAFSHGFQILPTVETEDTCTVEIVDRKTGGKVGKPVTFTLADAARMGLTGKGNWTKDPAGMLFARASSKAIRMYIPHVALGVMTLEEAEDLPFVEAEVVSDDVPFGNAD